MKTGRILFIGLLFALILTACGGGGGGAPVKMAKYEGGTLTIEYPDAWKDSSLDMFGVTFAVFSPTELGTEALMSMEDPMALFGDDPLVILMGLPAEFATEFDMDELDEEFLPEDEDVTIVRQGDVELGGAKGKEVVGKGKVEELGGRNVGVHVAMAERDDGSVIAFIAMTPEKDLDKNLDIFEYMLKSFEFK